MLEKRIAAADSPTGARRGLHPDARHPAAILRHICLRLHRVGRGTAARSLRCGRTRCGTARGSCAFVLYKGDDRPADTLLPPQQLVGRLRAEIVPLTVARSAASGSPFAGSTAHHQYRHGRVACKGRRFGGQVTCGLKVVGSRGDVLRESGADAAPRCGTGRVGRRRDDRGRRPRSRTLRAALRHGRRRGDVVRVLRLAVSGACPGVLGKRHGEGRVSSAVVATSGSTCAVPRGEAEACRSAPTSA